MKRRYQPITYNHIPYYDSLVPFCVDPDFSGQATNPMPKAPLWEKPPGYRDVVLTGLERLFHAFINQLPNIDLSRDTPDPEQLMDSFHCHQSIQMEGKNSHNLQLSLDFK